MRLGGCMALLALAAAASAAAHQMPAGFDVPDSVPRLDVNGSELPDACLADFAPTLMAPAGREGFVFAGTDGHFYFENGRRAIFWGVNIAKDAVFVPHAVIDVTADRLARAGLNLVRFHHLDGPEGLLPPERAGLKPRIDAEKLDCLDYWINALKQRGIYVYLDLLSYRTFYEDEGVAQGERLGRGAKPYAVFAERLIELQLQYARELLCEHTNPYTDLQYCNDPTICMVELCDENGLFIAQKRWGELLQPYRQELVRKWNFWLRQYFSNTAALRRAWSAGRGGQTVLSPAESVEEGTVILPGVSDDYPPSPGRRADVRRFITGVHRDYFATMREHLRDFGVKVPLLAVTDTTDPADVFAVAAELDAIGCNYYFDHPMFRSNDWQLPAFVSMANPLNNHTPDALLRRACGPRVFGKPLVIREVNICWPNPYRATGLLQAAGYGALNDIDALILFTYDTRAGDGGLGYFDIARDPTRWGIAPLAGRIFVQRLIGPARHRVAVAFGSQDVYRVRDDMLEDSVYELGAWCMLGNLMALPALPRKPDLALDVSEGASAGATYFSLGQDTPLPALSPQSWQGQPQNVQLDRVLGELAGGKEVGPSAGVIDCRQKRGLLRLHGVNLEALAGQLAKNSPSAVGALELGGGPETGAVIWYGLDGLGPGQSKRWLLKLVGNASNTAQQVTLHQGRSQGDIYSLLEPGSAPIITCRAVTAEPMVVSLNGTEVLRVWAQDAVIELGRDEERSLLFCDTPGVQIQLPHLQGERLIIAHYAQDREEAPGLAELKYPEGALLIEFAPLQKE